MCERFVLFSFRLELTDETCVLVQMLDWDRTVRRPTFSFYDHCFTVFADEGRVSALFLEDVVR